jgi:flagellar basal body-associated protein FliL
MSLAGDSVVYILVLLAVLAVVAGIMYAVAHMSKRTDGTAAGAYQDTSAQGTGTHRTA